MTTANLGDANRVLAADDIADTDITLIIEADVNGDQAIHTTTIAALTKLIADATLDRLQAGSGITLEAGANGRVTISASGG